MLLHVILSAGSVLLLTARVHSSSIILLEGHVSNTADGKGITRKVPIYLDLAKANLDIASLAVSPLEVC